MPIVAALPAIISGGASIIGGLVGSHAANKAGEIQSQAANKVAGMDTAAADKAAGGVNAATTDINKTISSAYDPYLKLGTQGATSLSDALKPGGSLTQQFSFDPSNIQNDPGYQFQLSEGLKALQRSAAARGELLGGGTLKAITQYGQGLAGTEFQNAYNRASNTFQLNRQNNLQALGMLTGYGANAANNFSNIYANTNLRGAEESGQFGMEGARLSGDALLGGANARAAGTVGAANSWQSALGGVANAANFYSMKRSAGSIPAYAGGGGGTSNVPVPGGMNPIPAEPTTTWSNANAY